MSIQLRQTNICLFSLDKQTYVYSEHKSWSLGCSAQTDFTVTQIGVFQEDIMSPVSFFIVFQGRYYVTCLFFQCLQWKILCHLSFFSSVFHGRYYVTCLFFLSVFHGRYYVTCLFLPVTKKITLHEYRKSYILQMLILLLAPLNHIKDLFDFGKP